MSAADTLRLAAVHLVAPAQHALAMRIAGFCAQHAADLSLERLCLELLGTGEYRMLAGGNAFRSPGLQIDKTGSWDWAKVTAWGAAARASTRRRI